MSRPRVLIADDHRVVAEGLVQLLGNHYDIIAAVNDGALVVDAVVRHRPDVVVLDLSMPNVSGLEVIQQLRAKAVETKVIVLTMHADANIAVETLRAGATGYVLKESSADEVLLALQVVLEGGTYLASTLTRDILRLMVGATDPSHVELTTRQQEVLRLIVRGQRAKEIAATLDLSTRAVEAIKYKTMQLLNVHSTAELVRYAVEHRLVPY